MTFTHAVSTDNYGPAKFIVSANSYEGTHTTIAAALTSASSGDTIFIRPGTYTENPTLKAGVNLVANTADSLTPNVIINGKCTFTGAGTVSMSGIQFQTNSDFAIAVTGSAASIINLDDCYINCSNNTGISYTSSSSSSQLNFYNVNGNLGTTGIGIFSMSSTGTFRWQNGLILNSGGSSTANTVSAGSFFPVEISLQNSLTISSAAIFVAGRCSFNGSNATAVTINSSGNCTCVGCNFTGGTASAITVTSGTFIVDFANVGSSNTNAITGAGTIKYGLITYTSTSSTNNVSTQTALPLQPTITSSVVVQQIRTNTTAEQTITSSITANTTTPTTSTGTSVISLSITPTNSSHILFIEGDLVCTSGGNYVCAYIIQNSAGNAIASFWQSAGAANYPMTIPIRYYMTAGGTSAITFALYATVVTGGNVYVNGNTSAAQLAGGTTFTNLTVTEYTS